MQLEAIERHEWHALNAVLWDVLPRHGTYGLPGQGDFVLLERSPGAWSHSVHFSRIDFVTPALVGDVQRLLRQRFTRWTVYFRPVAQLADRRKVEYLAVAAGRVEAHWDAARLIRRFGKAFVWGRRALVPSARAPTSGKRYASHVVKQRIQWRSLYAALGRLLGSHGSEDCMGRGDYWIVEDNYGGWDHKLCIHRMACLTPALAQSMQSLLRSRFPDWSILVQIEAKHDGRSVPPQGLRIRADALERHWNDRLLRRLFGSEFKWPAGEGQPRAHRRPDRAAAARGKRTAVQSGRRR